MSTRLQDEAIIYASESVKEAARMIETMAAEILCALREVRFNPEPPGSPAYVRRLRDQYVGHAVAGLCANLDGAKATAEIDRGTDIAETMGVTARAFAHAAIRALGYPVPGEESNDG